eukprot:TRINITY_DN74307_c0_g1_i1.p1 TRINITY_DN74307_c0_g1~~TRINITY_DN74307_c0_g1_i1.p1  ORF type:complete len:251 (+),score=61.18 TRINITY_DN74307_c0_g1_i1:40-753(+)
MALDLAHLQAIGLRLVGSDKVSPPATVEAWSGEPPLPLQPPATPVGSGEARKQALKVMATMQLKARELGLSSAHFEAVEEGYYDQPLEWRRDRLAASSTDELCKSIVMENTRISPDDDPQRIRCVLFIVQYVAKLANKEGMIRVMQALETARGLPALGKRQYNMRLLEGEECAKMTGFEHNAVTPLGLNLPVVVSDKIASLPSGTMWLGGGHVDLKLRVSVAELQAVLGATVLDITA